jgi:hypothetical protein
VAIINATEVDPAWQMGNVQMAQEHSKNAKKYSLIGTIIGAVFIFMVALYIARWAFIMASEWG